ncbi:hypothetical protein MN116_001434 [Schistosoma mekongi]|uniref:Protein SZT2 n=1 Tax=Schistosoma mekongi TaxID=38744 RepID=A0AAE1ZLB7_SCHME|nr:hypothetical protein MN116_001434 [Schistosoma mekongi]
MSDSENDCSILVSRLYACYTKSGIVPQESLITWFIDYLNYPFVYDEKCKSNLGFFKDPKETRDNPFHIVSFTTHRALQSNAILQFSEKSELFYLHHSYRFTFVIDFSWSTLCSSADGACYIGKALKTISKIFYLLSESNTYDFPGTGYKLADLIIYCSVIVVVPNSQCYTLLSGWAIDANEIPGKIAYISRSIIKLERKFLENVKNIRSHFTYSGRRYVSLSDLLRHGALSVSLLTPSSAPATILFLTDGCFSVPDFGVPELVMSHLNIEHIRCVFILMTDCINPDMYKSYARKNMLKQSSLMTAGIQQVELCNFLATNTNGFVITIPSENQHISAHTSPWDNMTESLLAIPILRHNSHTVYNRGFICGSRVMVKAGSKILELPTRTLLITRLKSGFQLKSISLSSKFTVRREGSVCNKGGEMEMCVPLSENVETPTEFAPTDIKLDLVMVWGVNITFHCSIRGRWTRLRHPSIITGASDISMKHVDEDTMLSYFSDSFTREKSWVELKVEANYSFLQEFVNRYALPRNSLGISSMFSRLPLPVQMMTLNDLLLTHVYEFNRDPFVRKIPDAFSNRLYSVFVMKNNLQGDSVAAPILQDLQPTNNPDYLSLLRFIDYWRLYIDIDLVQCYRWMDLHHIFLLLEYDSPLPPNLHFPPSDKRETSPLSCRQALFRVHTLLSQWSSFVLLENGTYIKLFHVGDFLERLIHKSSSLSSISSVPGSTQETVDSKKVNECDVGCSKTCSGVSVPTVSHFCLIRLELKIPEVRFCIGFICDTPIDVQREIVEYLEAQLKSLRFPPRGRQAIPKSRHKSGTFQHSTECKYVPPLQRSWEDTPCCIIFSNRLDRLVINSGTFCNSVAKASDFLSPDKNQSIKLDHAQESEHVSRAPKKHRLLFLQSIPVTYPTTNPVLLGQHLHHSICVWAVFSSTWKSCMQSIFSSLLNIRLQEGFHLARVGPQPGFISLLTELEIQRVEILKANIPCLVQYQVYPTVDSRNTEFQHNDLGHLTVINDFLKSRIDALVSDVMDSPNSPSVIESEKFSLSPIIIVSEIWIQPIDGTVNAVHLEADNWSGSTFSELPRIMFNEDEDCIVSYTTLDNLYNFVTNKSKVYIGSPKKTTSVGDDAYLQIMCPTEVCLVYSSISKLISRCPNLIALLPLLGHIVNRKASSNRSNVAHNDCLLANLQSRLLNSGFLVEVPISVSELKDIFTKLGYILKPEWQENCDVDFPNLRCFIGRGPMKQSTVVSDIVDELNPMVTIVLVPSTLSDAFHPIIFGMINSHIGVFQESNHTCLPYLPVFLYACSRVYMSYLIDDKWTYKVPDTHIIDMRSNDQCFLRSDKHDCNIISKLYLLLDEVPDCFLNVGCQNERLTQELHALWFDLMFYIDVLEHSHSYAFSASIYRIVTNNSIPDARDVNYVLRHCEICFPIQPLYLDLTSFALLTCSHLFAYVNLLYRSSKYPKGSTHSKLLPIIGCQKPKRSAPLHILDSENLSIEFHVSSTDNCNCCEVQTSCLYDTFSEYLTPVPKLDGLYVLSKCKLMGQGNHIVGHSVNQNILGSLSKTKNIVEFMATSGHAATSVSNNSSITSDLFSKASAESEALWNSSALTSRKAAFFHSSHSVLHSSDFLVRKLAEWFYLFTDNSSDVCPLFLRIRGVLEYKGKSIVLPLSEGLPTFCAARFHGILSELILKSAFQHNSPIEHKVTNMSNNSVLKIDLGQLYFYVEIQPIFRPHWDCFSHKLYDSVSWKLRNKTKTEMHSAHGQNQHLKSSDTTQSCLIFKSYSINMAYSTMEEECIAIDDWLNQNNVSKIPSIQRCFIRLFIFQILWHLHDKLVNCLRLLTPVTEKSLEIILRHIEDTYKAMHTPLFSPCRVLANHSHMSSSEDELSKSDVRFEKSSTTVDQQCTISQNFRNLRKQVRMQRIHLDFVLYDTEVVDQFAKYFMNMLVSHSYGYPHYINGYYYLSDFFENSVCITEKRCKDSSCEIGNRINYFPGVGSFRSGVQTSRATMDKHFSPQPFLSSSVCTTHITQKGVSFKSFKSRRHNYKSILNAINALSRKESSYLSKRNAYRLRRSYSLSTLESHYSKVYNKTVFKNRRPRNSASLSRANVSKKIADSFTFNDREQLSNDSLPFWFIFRICSNSVNVFFHHTDSHINSIYCLEHWRDLSLFKFPVRKPSSYQTSEDLPLDCIGCTFYQNVMDSIYSVIRMLNQKLLLTKLYDERLCDELLLPSDEVDTVTKRDHMCSYDYDKSSIQRRSLNGSNLYKWKMQTKHRLRSFTRHFSPIDKKNMAVNGQKLNTYSNIPSHIEKSNCIKSSIMLDATKYSLRVGNNPTEVLFQRRNWPPGVFACPVQMTSYICLHPRVFLNSQIYSVEKGRRIIPALRRLLENLAITNRSNMFFLIDHPSRADSNSASAKRKIQAYRDSEVQSVHSFSQYPVFYMLLKEVTTATFSSEQQLFLSDKRTNQIEPKHLSELKLSTKMSKTIHIYSDISTSAYFGSSEQTSQSGYDGNRLMGNSEINYSHNCHFGENVLQITLHGISQPSRQLCASVHHMLQTRLDGLVLQHISDSLSRNAINRLTLEDLVFLFNRRINHPHIHFYISLPKFLMDVSDSLFFRQGILSFCHYFRQNLLLFLTPVKIDDDTKQRLKNLGKAELYLFNRPSAQGFSKHGVATVLIQLMIVSSDETSQTSYSSIRPYVITEHTSPNESNSKMSCSLCFQGLSEAIKNFTEVSVSDLQDHHSLIHSEPRLVLSIRMWERGHSDLNNLKLRLKTAVHHSLYDLIIEHFVLTSPVFPNVECRNHTSCVESSQNFYSIYVANPDSKNKSVCTKEMPINSLIYQWMKEGRTIESPLVTDVSVSLSSCLFVEQLISDFLKPFIYHDEVPVLDSSPNTTFRKQDSGADFSCVSNIPNGTFSPSESATSSSHKSETKFEENVDVFRPGSTNKYIIVGRNLNAWKKALNVTQIGQQPKTLTIPKLLDKTSKIRLIEFTSDSGIHYDTSSRMQPLKVNISPNYFSINIESNPPFKRIHRNDDDTRLSSGNDNKRRATQSSDSHRCLTDSCCNSGPLVSGFPEFCPVKIEMTQHSAVDTNNSTHLSPTNRSDSNECLNQNSPITQEKYGINIHIPRQSLCLIFVNGRYIQMFTYNWAKEEAERLSTRLLLSVEWYNQRYQLLCSLSLQKLGLFHAINNNVFRGCAVRAMDLIRYTCPPELNISMDSACTSVSQTSSNLYNTSPLPSVSSTATAQTIVSNISMSTFSAASSVTRRRHATPSAVDVNTSYVNNNNNNFFIPSSPAFQTYLSSLHGTSNSRTDIKENKTVNNFLRLFQDCGYIPHLIPPANPHLPYIDILQRYSKQALTLIDADIRRSQYIELFSAYFRNWQEGSKNSTINKESNLTQSVPLNKDSGPKCPHSKSGGGSADALLLSDQLSKRLQRYSAIKQACRQLHTICTPILFCPNTRSKVVQLIKEEENAMNKTAHLYFSSVSHNLTAVKPTDATEALATSTNSTTERLTVHNEINDSDKIHYHTEQAANHFTSCGNKVNSSNNMSLKSTSLKLKQIPDATGNRFLSPWLSWSHNSATPGNLDDASLLSTDILLIDNNPHANVAQYDDNCHTSIINFNMWLRRVAHQFLMKYSQYLQQEVGFNSIPILNNSVTLNRREQTTKHNVNYALFRRSIHLAGVHIIELFIRDFHLFVRLGTIEVSRFSWHASRSVTLGPYTSEVIAQTAASAAASMTSVMFNAVFRRKLEKSFRLPTVSSSFNAISNPSECKYSDWFQYSSSFSWNESSKLCDYTHLHSFSYDFHLRAIQDYLENRRCFHRNQCSDASRKPSSTIGNVYSAVITIPDYPVTRFLEDLSCIAQKLPLFSRGYLCCFPVTCHVSLCLRPDQVFHHLIEEHASYGVDILRMTRSEYGTSQTNPSYNKHLSYNFALVEQFHPEHESACCSSRSVNSDHHSKYQPYSNLRMSSESNSSLTISNDQSYKFSALGIANTHHIVENLTKLGGELSNLQSISQPYSVTGIVVPDEINGTYSDIRSPVNGSITNRLLHLIVYLIILDSKHEFPESRLAKLNSSSCTHCPVDWPAVRPCVDPCSFTYQPTLINRIPKSLGIEDTDLSVLITDRQYQNLYVSSTFTSDDMRFSKNSENTFDSDVRWHMSYLSMCPSHQVQLHRVLRISQSNLESRITQLIGRSGVDCHKNLLWYKLFDTNSSLASQILSTSSHSLSQDTVESNYRMEHTPSISLGTNPNPIDSYLCPVLNHQSLSMREIEELVDSAPFQLDILRLDPRLIELFNVGGCHLNTVSGLLNKEFVNLQQNGHHEIDHVKSNTSLKLYKYSNYETIACIAYRFSHSIEDNLDEALDSDNQSRQCIKNYMVLLSPSFTEGLIFLSWCETRIGERVFDEHFSLYTSSAINDVCTNRTSTSGGCVDIGKNNVRKTQSITTKSKTNKYKDFQFRAVFRAVGDPTNPSSMRRLIDSGIEIQNLFFKTSTLSLVATNFIEKLSFLVWKTMHN